MRRVSRLADHGVLWWIVALALGAFGGKNRRAAVRGIASLLLSSALANAVLKPLFPRRRPPARTWLNPHRGVPIPRSSAFPSGHSASAAAFTTGVALESPVAGAAVAPLAAAVIYSRVHNGVHWPGDVVVGSLVGSAVALSTRRWWAVRDDEPAVTGPTQYAPALPLGRGLVVFVNQGSGPEGQDITSTIAEYLPGADIVNLDADRDFAEQIDDDIRKHQSADGVQPRQALGVCGGDGTVIVVADAAERHQLPLAVFPGGTLNHFARDIGSAEVSHTAAAVEAGTAVAVDRASVTTGSEDADTHSFLNTSSLGGYPDAVRLRERWESRLGKWLAAALAMIRVLAAAKPLAVTIDGTPRRVWMLFVGNGRYSPGDQVPMSRPAITGRFLDVRYLRADRRFSRARLLFAALTGTLRHSRVYQRTITSSVSVQVLGDSVALATDGEVVADAKSFMFVSHPQSLTVYRDADLG
ncbi:MAG: phosphatase PAP2 family protein [Rhodococcus sp.]|nr:phosphatase PAP2 family protein [Rhodococcus sp. (in: high G+C Gram-positive bacteria)]